MKKLFLYALSYLVLNASINAQWTGSTGITGNIYRTGNVGIGVTSPILPLEVNGAIKSQFINFIDGGSIVGFLGKGINYTGGWSATPNILALTYNQRDFAIGGWKKSDGSWGGASIYVNSDNGYTGIGTTTPDAKLEVQGAIRSSGITGSSGSFEALNAQNGNTYFLTNTTSGNGLIKLNKLDGTNSILFNSLGTTFFNGGNVLIGKTTQLNSSYDLDVNGDIRANKVVVNTNGADYVFEKNFKLKSLNDVENYIKKHQHLPDVKPAKSMQANGVDVGENQTVLLQKIEELTLYVIQLNKENKELYQRLEKLEKK